MHFSEYIVARYTEWHNWIALQMWIMLLCISELNIFPDKQLDEKQKKIENNNKS